MLSAGSHRIRSAGRDWALFALCAALPALAAGALGFRAVEGEQAAVERTMALEIDRAAAKVGAEYAARLGALEGELSRGASAWQGAPSALPFAETVVVRANGRALPDRPAGGAAERQDCERLSEAYASGQAPARAAILRHCRDAKSSSGAWLWLLAALDGREPVDAAAVAAWLSAHPQALGDEERAAVRRDIERAPVDARERSLLLDALAAAPARAAALELASAHIASGSPEISWQDSRSRGWLSRGDAGYRGAVIHRGSIARALQGGWPALPAGMKAALVIGRERPDRAAVELLPGGAYLAIGWADPELPNRRATRARRLLVAAAACASALAVAFAALLFARMRAARALSALRTDFVAAVSHELRTPIASIRVLAELLADGKIDGADKPEAQRTLAIEAERLGATVDRLLDLRRMDSGKLSGARIRAAIGPVVARAIDSFERRAPEHGPVLREIDVAVEAPIDADAVMLAVDNLLRNALKHAPAGTPYQVRVARAGRGAAISVADRGPGVAQRDWKRIFRPFERADDRLSQATEGTGIGLTLVAHVAKAHGGRAWVEPRPGGGAIFTIWLRAS